MRCTSTRLTAIWQPETRGRFHLPHCPIPGVHFYELYGITDKERRYATQWSANGCWFDHHVEPETPYAYGEPPPLALGERAFEIVMARRMAACELETTWFTRHGATPITEFPAHWHDDYCALVARRIALIETDRFIGLLERPEYKRRWNIEPWHAQEQRALRTWLLNRLESPAYWPVARLATVRSLAERAATDTDFQQVATRYSGHAGVDLAVLIENLVESGSVPALPIQRYRSTGLAKRADWNRTWSLQRREDDTRQLQNLPVRQAFAPQNTRFWSRRRVWFQFTVGEDKPPMLSVDNRGKGVLSMDCSAKRSPL